MNDHELQDAWSDRDEQHPEGKPWMPTSCPHARLTVETRNS